MGLCESLTNLVKEPILFLLRWWKQASERKYQNLSHHAKKLLQQTDVICGIAKAMKLVVEDEPGSSSYRSQASILWKASSTSSFLNAWLANTWILERGKKTRKYCALFQSSVERLHKAAIVWYEADKKWRASKGLARGEYLIGGDPEQESGSEAIAKLDCAQTYLEAYEDFLSEYQAIQHALQPFVQDYGSSSDEAN